MNGNVIISDYEVMYDEFEDEILDCVIGNCAASGVYEICSRAVDAIGADAVSLSAVSAK